MKLRCVLALGVALVGTLGALSSSQAESDVQKSVAEARRTLRQQGFKTDLSDFDFSTDDQTAARAAVLTNFFVHTRPIVVLQPCGTECALVAWKQADPEEQEGYQNFPPFEQVLATNQTALDMACKAVLGGPIRFPLTARQGGAMLLTHLAPLRSLSEALTAKVLVDLRTERYEDAWTNLLVLTRLATAWEPEPSEVSHLVRFNLARTAWKVTWQAFQAHAWTDAQLAALQSEWENADFLKGLPETAAFKRACTVDSCIRERNTPIPSVPLKDVLENAIHSPSSLAADAKYRWNRAQYHAQGTYEDEHDLLLFFRDCELELRKAVAASTWRDMRGLPGATNTIPFRSKYSSSVMALLNTRQMTLGFQLEGRSFLGRAAETETRRRVVIAAIALERYRLAQGSYPHELPALVPSVLESVPPDFMDGKPLRYRLCAADAFVLYSVGVDCVDDGGRLSPVKRPRSNFPRWDPFDDPDLLWPRAASDSEAQGLHLEQARAKVEQTKQWEREAEQRDRENEQRRRDAVALLAAVYAKSEPVKIEDPKVEGVLLSQSLRNKASSSPALRLDQMLTLRRIATGKEPGTASFELPISYDALQNLGTLRLLCDAAPGENSSHDSAQVQDCERAPNGNCLLIWDTTYDPPGQHFLQAELSIERRGGRSRRNPQDEEMILRGPLFSFVSTNLLQFFPLGNVYSDKGAFFRVKLAQPIGSYSLRIMAPSGEPIHTISGNTTNGLVEVHWDLTYGNGRRYTNESFNASWTVTFPDPPAAGANLR